MYRDGYIVRCCGPNFDIPVLYFCVFGEGTLSMYTAKGGKLVSEIVLSGHVTKVCIERMVQGQLPHRFSLSVAQVVRTEGRRMRMKMAEPKLYKFAAPTNDLMKEWANALHLWRRMNWKENVKFCENAQDVSLSDEKALLLLHLQQYHATQNNQHRGRTSNPSTGLMRLKKVLTTMQPQLSSPSLRKLRRQAISTVTQSSSCATTMTARVA